MREGRSNDCNEFVISLSAMGRGQRLLCIHGLRYSDSRYRIGDRISGVERSDGYIIAKSDKWILATRYGLLMHGGDRTVVRQSTYRVGREQGDKAIIYP